jgi:hypothetical protein
VSAELEARRTAVAAVLADFQHDLANGLTFDGSFYWAVRLAAELRSLLEAADWQAAALDNTTTALARAVMRLDTLDTEASQLAAIRLVLDVLDWQDAGLFQDALEQIDDIVRGES